MPNTNNVVIPGVSGSIDGKVPVYNPEGRFQTWELGQLWFGTHGENRYVPNVKDLVVNVESGEWFYVFSINDVTLIPTLKPWNEKVQTGGITKEDLLIGVGPGKVSDTFRCYIDKSVRPYTLTVDGRCKLYGKDIRYIQICKGNDLDGTLKVISGLYDQSGNWLGTDVPLVLANMRDHSNYCTWAIPECVTSEELEDNDVVQLRAFSDTGGLKSKFPLLVENSAYIRLTDTAYKYVTHISLESPFMSTSDIHTLEYPLNVPLRGLNLFGVVHYNDGSTLRMPVDGSKFQVFGLEYFVATTVGERTPFYLQYNLSRDEMHYGSTVSTTHTMQQSYTAISTKEDGSYTVKLFAYPFWIDEINGYRLEFFMYNLDRKNWDKVTPYVTYNQNLPAFNPRLYGVAQQISVSLDLNKINPTYKKWIHVQVIDLVLYRHATDHSSTPWTVAFERNQPTPFGRDNWIKVTYIDAANKKLDITCGETLFPNWLERMYWNTKPLYSPMRESKAPEPNMFAIHTRDSVFEFPIKQWNSALTVRALIGAEDTLYIRFFKRTQDNDLQLAIAGVPLIMMNAAP